jgi:hypothetical protein
MPSSLTGVLNGGGWTRRSGSRGRLLCEKCAQMEKFEQKRDLNCQKANTTQGGKKNAHHSGAGRSDGHRELPYGVP